MAFGARVTTITQDEKLPQVIDTILNSNVFATRMLAKAKPWKGEKMKKPIKYKKGVTGTSFTGFDIFSTTASDVRVDMEYSPKFYEVPVALPLDEISVNATESKVLDLISLDLESRSQDMADDLGTIFYSDGTGNSSKDFLGLGALVDDGTSVATIGGLSRSTYSTLASTVTASGGTLTLLKMSTLYNAISSGMQKPSIGITTEDGFSYFEQLLLPQERIAKDVGIMKNEKGMEGGTGFTGLYYKGMPILADEKCTSGYLYFLNEEFIEWRALPLKFTSPIKFKSTDIKGNDYSKVTGLGFSWSDWIKPTNGASLVGHIYLGGELVNWNPKRSGVLTGLTGV